MPILNLAVVGIVVLVGFLWAARGKGRGAFSSMLACACTLVAGAIALAVWEPLTYGVFLGLHESLGWTLGLLVPFIVTLLVLRIAVDQTVRANLDFGDITNFVGGAIFGLVNGVITAGIIVLAISFLRFGPAAAGYEPVKDERGNLVDKGSLWIPVDRLTIGLYEKLSLTTLSVPDPLALRMPAAYEQAAMSRRAYATEEESSHYMARTAAKPGDFNLKGRYRIEGPLKDIAADSNNEKPQEIVYADGTKPPANAVLEGFLIEFNSGFVEKSGQVLIGGGQVRLVCKLDDNTAKGFHPVAIIAAPEAGAGLRRFRLDSDGVYVGSPGGQSNPVYGFEFIVPPGAQPTDLFLRNARLPLEGAFAQVDSKNVLRTAKVRDDGIRDLSLFSRFGVAASKRLTNLDTTGAQTISLDSAAGATVREIEAGGQFPDQLTLNKGNIGSIELNGKNEIVGGEYSYDTTTLANNRGIDRDLRVDSFGATRDTGIVRVTLAKEGAQSLLGQSVAKAESILQPLLIDDQGNSYEAIGFLYRDSKVVQVRFTPDRPIRAMTEAPSLSTSKRDQSLYLIFRPTKGVNITGMVLGTKQMAKFEPALFVR